MSAANEGQPRKPSYIGAPAVFALELACQHLTEAFPGPGCFLVGSAIERQDWRDVDIRLMMFDEEFSALFACAYDSPAFWEHNPRWLLMTTAISNWLTKQTGLPIDFQFQPMSWANKRHDKPRQAVGMRIKINENPLPD